jgi:hypothetical protein
MVSRIIKERTKIGPKGEAASQANLDYWAERASANSYHGPKSREEGTDYANSDLNHEGEGNYLPKVRRIP